MYRTAAIATELPRHRLIDGLLDRVALNQPHAGAWQAGESYLVIDPTGRIAACQMELEQPVTDLTSADPAIGGTRTMQTPGACNRVPRNACSGLRLATLVRWRLPVARTAFTRWAQPLLCRLQSVTPGPHSAKRSGCYGGRVSAA
ncbi:MAG: hypothetical protein IPK16_21130 [Anaerolineales bacterium]|nr:hypothetical protein [Anaerolineales bacterium]